MADAVADFWRSFLTALPPEAPHHDRPDSVFAFGDSPHMADDLGALVLEGSKTATSSALWSYEDDGEPLPRPGELAIVLDGRGAPLCVLETTEVRVVPFRAVDAAFAFDEGEGDRSLAYWRDAHERFFRRTLGEGRAFSPEMPVVCERFRVVYRGE